MISENKISNDQELVKIDSTQNPVIKNPVAAAVFEIVPQEISAGKGRSVFTQNGKTLFYMEQNSNKGNIKIDGKDYTLNTVSYTHLDVYKRQNSNCRELILGLNFIYL